MKPQETGKRYDAIALWWDAQQGTMSAGMHYIERAISLCSKRRKGLDVGCGSGGRIIDALTSAGFEVLGIDVSESMLALAKSRHPAAKFVHGDVCEWEPSDKYDLIIAWDSVFHVPHGDQRTVVEKLCAALVPGGVLLFTAGGIDGEITGEMNGHTFYYSSLADEEYIEVLKSSGCTCVLMDRDQYPEHHIVLLAVREDA